MIKESIKTTFDSRKRNSVEILIWTDQYNLKKIKQEMCVCSNICQFKVERKYNVILNSSYPKHRLRFHCKTTLPAHSSITSIITEIKRAECCQYET